MNLSTRGQTFTVTTELELRHLLLLLDAHTRTTWLAAVRRYAHIQVAA